MNNIYIFRIDDFSEEDAIMAKKFDKSDKVIFMPNQTGMMMYSLFPLIGAWKIQPTFMQPIKDSIEKEPMLFVLGLQCANCNGNMYIVMRDNPFYALNGCEFDTLKGTVVIHVAEQLSDVLPARKSRQQKKQVQAESQDVADSVEDEEENLEDAGVTGDEGITEDEGEETQVSDEEETVMYDDAQFEDAPDGFVKAIVNIQKQTGVNLIGRVNGLYECFKESKDDLLPTFEYQLNLRFDEEVVENYMAILQPYMEVLREAVEE